MDRSSDERNPVERLAEEFLARYRRGERPPIEGYVERYPEWADEVRELFPALVMMERLKPGPADRDDTPARPAAAGRPLERLGDFVILREVGRGGMGVVYEAVQESLGRHVALKVLPHAPMDPRRLERFRLEARSAAGLHHTNIVPVFGVGEQDGVHYYAMQYIHGQGLDKVLEDVRRLRDGEGPPSGAPGPATTAGATTAEVALGLVTGRFLGPATDIREPAGDRIAEGSATIDFVPDPVPTGPCPGGGPGAPEGGPTAPSALSGLSGTRYALSVARVGVQVAEALAHAHGQGILHRDIKPSNLLMDADGTVWVTDFGLAKAEGTEGPTASHDVVGTLRFMAPERFAGRSDPRCDVYALGVTLYELLTLRPAVEAPDRAQLIECVLHRDPPRPRQVDPGIPRDLETIVLKAMAKDPAARYASAAALAEDLGRFLEGRPIRARKTSLPGQAWRWCRRNPTMAGLAAAVGVLTVALAIGSTAAALRLGHSLRRAEAAERERTDQLWDSLRVQARAGRLSHRIGRRLDGLDALAKAARIRVADAVRDEAIACLALIDLRLVRLVRREIPDGSRIDFDASLGRYAVGDGRGEILVRRVDDGRELLRLHGPRQAVTLMRFSPDGRHLTACYRRPKPGGDLFIWDLQSGRPAARLAVAELDHGALDFSPDGTRFAVALPDDAIGLHETATGRELRRLKPGPRPARLAFHPDGRRLAATSMVSHEVRVLDVERDEVVWKVTLDAPTSGVAWRGDGRLLAVGCSDMRVHVWDRERDLLQSVLEGHTNLAVDVDFVGELLLTSGWDNSTRAWDPIRGKLLLETRQGLRGVGADGRHVVLREVGSSYAIWELIRGREFRVLHHGWIGNRTRRPHSFGPYHVDHSPDGRLLASAGVDRIRLWDAASGDELASLPGGSAGCARFSPDGSHLLTFQREVLRLWPIRPEDSSSGDGIRIGSPRALCKLPGTLDMDAQADWSGSGRLIAAVDRGRGQVVVLDPETAATRRLGGHPGVRHVAISPDGRWVATGTWGGRDIKVWDVVAGTLAWERPCRHGCAAFSPDGRWLATTESLSSACRLWRVGSWRPGATITSATGGGEVPFTMAFAPDGASLALDRGNGLIQLVAPDTGRSLATLTAPSDYIMRPTALSFSPDGGQLAAATEDHTILLWDLRLLRAHLADIGLDWDAPPLASPRRGAGDVPPPSVRVIAEAPWVTPARQADEVRAAARLNRAFPAVPFVGGYFVVPGALEGEALAIRDAVGGRAWPQDMRGFGTSWSGGRQLLWGCTTRGGILTLEVPVTETGLYDVSAALTRSYDFGIASVSLDGRALGEPMDLYNPEVVHQEVRLGRVELTAGPHLLRVTMGRKNPASAGYFFGLDWIKLDPVR